MDKSYKFKHIEDNLMKIFQLINNNKNIAKYIYYLTDDPLSEPDVPIDLLKNGHFFFTFFDESIPDKEKIRMYINPIDGDLDNPSLSNIRILIEVVLPNKYVVLNGLGYLRPFRIHDEITQMIDQQELEVQDEKQNRIGMTKPIVKRFRNGRINAEYSVYAIEVIVNSSTLKGKR